MAAGLEVGRIAVGRGLHMATDAKVGDHRGVGRAGNRLAVSEGVDTFDQVTLRTIVHTHAGAAEPRVAPNWVIRELDGSRAIADVMALQTQGTLASIGDYSAVWHRHRGQHPDLMRVVGGGGQAVRLMAGLAADRGVHRVCRVGVRAPVVVHPANESVGRMAAYAHPAAWAGGNGRSSR